MRLHLLKKASNAKTKRRIGRGGKRGSYSGRGIKGQRSRAGRRIRPAIRDLISRIPKRRGFQNKQIVSRPMVFNLDRLALRVKSFAAGKNGAVTVDHDFLKTAGLVPLSFRGLVKVLGDGEISVPIQLRGIAVSKSAKIKIEKAGGSVQ